MTAVYGPTRDLLKPAFLRELRRCKPDEGSKWLLLGDFNLIYRARDKNNRNLNQSRMRQFRAALNSCKLREIHLQNRKYTWSNERRRPTMLSNNMGSRPCPLPTPTTARCCCQACPGLGLHDPFVLRTFGQNYQASPRRFKLCGSNPRRTPNLFESFIIRWR